MDAYFFHILFFSSLFLSIEAFEANCPTVKCGHGGPDIHFPFHVKGQQPQYSGHSGFELVCKDNTTIIHFPSYGNLAVKSISYDTKRINLFDPKNCVHEVFLNLNFSLTPFSYYYFVKNYTYLNCSTRLSPSFIEVPCLSGSSHHVYTVESTLAVPVSCRPVKTMAIPFSYSPYLADNSFGLGLTWSFNGCEDCEAKRGQWGFQSKSGLQTGCLNAEQDKGFAIKHLILGVINAMFLKVLLLVLAVTALISIKIYHLKKPDERTENSNLLQVVRDRIAPNLKETAKFVPSKKAELGHGSSESTFYI